jgi:hypothetical protein
MCAATVLFAGASRARRNFMGICSCFGNFFAAPLLDVK